MRLSICLITVLSLFTYPSYLYAQSNVTNLYQAGMQAYEQKEFVNYLTNFIKLDSLHPYHPVILQKLAGAYNLNHQPAKAIACLHQLALVKADTSFINDPDIAGLSNTREMKMVLNLVARQNEPVLKSQLAYTIPEKDLHPEAIVYDHQSQRFYLSSIHKRKIISIDQDGKLEPIVQYPQDSLWAVSGLRCHQGYLWATMVSIPQMVDFDSTQLERSALIQIDLNQKKVINTYEVEDGERHWFGDLNIHPDGTVYITDSRQPILYQLSDKSQKLVPFFTHEKFRSLQGLTFSASGKFIFIADYANGIFVLDINSGNLHAHYLEISGAVAKAIDGLYFYNNSLIAIQNGLFPKRITQFYLAPDLKQINHYRILERSNPLMDEPTLGDIVGDKFYYIANSPWNHYDKSQQLNVEKLKDVKILSVSLE